MIKYCILAQVIFRDALMADVLTQLSCSRELSAEMERNPVCLQAGGEPHRLCQALQQFVLFHKCALSSMDN